MTLARRSRSKLKEACEVEEDSARLGHALGEDWQYSFAVAL
jgi:hypothetical protein